MTILASWGLATAVAVGAVPTIDATIARVVWGTYLVLGIVSLLGDSLSSHLQ